MERNRPSFLILLFAIMLLISSCNTISVSAGLTEAASFNVYDDSEVNDPVSLYPPALDVRADTPIGPLYTFFQFDVGFSGFVSEQKQERSILGLGSAMIASGIGPVFFFENRKASLAFGPMLCIGDTAKLIKHAGIKEQMEPYSIGYGGFVDFKYYLGEKKQLPSASVINFINLSVSVIPSEMVYIYYDLEEDRTYQYGSAASGFGIKPDAFITRITVSFGFEACRVK